jgi:hypothetical protein
MTSHLVQTQNQSKFDEDATATIQPYIELF